MLERPRIIDVVRKPNKCPVCGERPVDIIYGTRDMTKVKFLKNIRKAPLTTILWDSEEVAVAASEGKPVHHYNVVNNSELVTNFSIIAVSLRTKYSSGQ